MIDLKNSLLVTDGDGAATGYSWNTPVTSWRPGGRSTLFASIAERWSGNTILVSNRPGNFVEEAIKDAHHSCRLAFGESGGVIVATEGNQIVFPNNDYESFRKKDRHLVIQTVQEVIDQMGLGETIKQAPGFYTAICFYPAKGKEVGKEFFKKVARKLGEKRLLDSVSLSLGDALDVFPKKPQLLDKSVAIRLLPRIYEEVYRQKLPDTIVGAGDGKADIVMFEAIKRISKHYIFLTNDNANDDVKEYVREHGGIVSRKPFASGIEDALYNLVESQNSHKERWF